MKEGCLEQRLGRTSPPSLGPQVFGAQEKNMAASWGAQRKQGLQERAGNPPNPTVCLCGGTPGILSSMVLNCAILTQLTQRADSLEKALRLGKMRKSW